MSSCRCRAERLPARTAPSPSRGAARCRPLCEAARGPFPPGTPRRGGAPALGAAASGARARLASFRALPDGVALRCEAQPRPPREAPPGAARGGFASFVQDCPELWGFFSPVTPSASGDSLLCTPSCPMKLGRSSSCVC